MRFHLNTTPALAVLAIFFSFGALVGITKEAKAAAPSEEAFNELSKVLSPAIYAGFNKTDRNSGFNCYVEIVGNPSTENGNRSIQVAVWNQWQRESYRLFSVYMDDGFNGPITTDFDIRHKLGQGEAMYTVKATESTYSSTMGETISKLKLTFFKKDSGEIVSVAVTEDDKISKCDLSKSKIFL